MPSNDTFDEIEVSENHIIGEHGFADHTEYEVHTGMADEYRISEQLAERVREQYGLDLEEDDYRSGCDVIVVPEGDSDV